MKTDDVSYILIRTQEQSEQDIAGEVHQHTVYLSSTSSWQQVVLENLAAPVHWGGNNDGQWQGPLTQVSVLIEKPGVVGGKTQATILLDDVTVSYVPPVVASDFDLPLGGFDEAWDGWWIFRDKEGSLDIQVDNTIYQTGGGSLRIPADFSGGRTWQSMIKMLDARVQISDLSFYVRAENMDSFGLEIRSSEGQLYTASPTINTTGTWQLVTLNDIPLNNATIAENDSKLFGAVVAIRISASPDDLINSGQPGTLWIDDVQSTAHGFGPIYQPMNASIGDGPVTLRLEYPQSIPVFWGPGNTPSYVTATFTNRDTAAHTVPAIVLRDHTGAIISTLHSGGNSVSAGQSWSQALSLNLSDYGQYSVTADLGSTLHNTLYAKLAWIAAPAEPDPDSTLGVQLHLAHGPWGKHQNIGGAEGAMQLAADLGASWVRDDINPSFDGSNQVVASNPGYFTIQSSLLQAAGLTPLLTFTNYISGPPDTSGEWSTYAARFASVIGAYGSFCRVFEVWNEPNISPGWGGTPDASDYAELLEAAYTAGKTRDATVTILGGATSGTDYAFLETVLSNGAFLDGVSVHPYHHTSPELDNILPSPLPQSISLDTYMSFSERMDGVGNLADFLGLTNLPIWATEMGFESVNTEQLWQHTCWLIRQQLLGLANNRLQRQFVYNLQNQGYDFDPLSGMTFGLLRADGTPEPQAVALNTLARMLHGKTFNGWINDDPDVFAMEFVDSTDSLLVLWADDDSITIDLALLGASAEVTDLMGNTSTVTASGGTIPLTITDEPVFVIEPLGSGGSGGSGGSSQIFVDEDFQGLGENPDFGDSPLFKLDGNVSIGSGDQAVGGTASDYAVDVGNGAAFGTGSLMTIPQSTEFSVMVGLNRDSGQPTTSSNGGCAGFGWTRATGTFGSYNGSGSGFTNADHFSIGMVKVSGANAATAMYRLSWANGVSQAMGSGNAFDSGSSSGVHLDPANWYRLHGTIDYDSSTGTFTFTLTLDDYGADGTAYQSTVLTGSSSAVISGYGTQAQPLFWANAARGASDLDSFSVLTSGATEYTLTVNSGSGSGDYEANEEVTVTAGSAPSGYAFYAWTGNTQYLDDAYAASTTLTMPAQTVTITATYLQELINEDFQGLGEDPAFGDSSLFKFDGSVSIGSGDQAVGGTASDYAVDVGNGAAFGTGSLMTIPQSTEFSVIVGLNRDSGQPTTSANGGCSGFGWTRATGTFGSYNGSGSGFTNADHFSIGLVKVSGSNAATAMYRLSWANGVSQAMGSGNAFDSGSSSGVHLDPANWYRMHGTIDYDSSTGTFTFTLTLDDYGTDGTAYQSTVLTGSSSAVISGYGTQAQPLFWANAARGASDLDSFSSLGL